MTDNQLTAMAAAIVAVAQKHHLTLMATAAEIRLLADEAAKAAGEAYEANVEDKPA